MHTVIKELLPDAEGKSEYIIALFVDIRGFSSFSKTIDSTLTAIFIKKFYLKLINDYFAKASFFKPTGDGLMITIPTNEKDLRTDIENTIKDCFNIVENFPTFFSDEPMINFPVPEKVGIGLSRGPASYLISGEKIIDYSGDVLNKAARLMDIARPSGIVFDSSFGINLLPVDLQKKFSHEKVFIRSFAESEPIDVYYSKDFTVIRPSMKVPLNEVQYEKVEYSYTLSKMSTLSVFTYQLPSKPLESDKIRIKLMFPKIVSGRVVPGIQSYLILDTYEYFEEAGEPRIKIDFPPLCTKLKGKNLKNTHKIELQIIYEKLNN